MQHLSWCDVMNWSNEKHMEFLLDSNKVNQKDKEFLCTQYFKTRMHLFHELHLCSSDDKNFGEGVADKVHLSSREELWQEESEGPDKSKRSKGKKPKPVGPTKW